MGFFSKGQKKEDRMRNGNNRNNPNSSGLPSLPELPQEIPEIKTKSSNLPSLPNSVPADQFNRASIKDAVTTRKMTEEIQEFPEMYTPSPRNNPPKRSYHMEPLHSPRSMEMSEWDEHESYSMPAQPLFIKLDTFEKAVSSFNEIKLRISEIESLLRDIKEIKNREEAELSEWEKEIETIKSRLEQINHDIFNKLE